MPAFRTFIDLQDVPTILNELVDCETSKTATGTTRTDAYPIVKMLTNFTTAAASTGCVLPAGRKGDYRIIFNGGASVMKVYAAGSSTIDGTAGATGVSLTNANRCEYFCVADGVWISAKLGVVSS